MDRNRVFKYYQDPGHGWIAVTKEEIEELGIQKAISHFSYLDKDYVYLEEDCDAPMFIKAFFCKLGEEPKLQEIVSDNYSFIRGLKMYSPESLI